MEVIRAIVFSAVQGLTEFFPVSSTAHLILLPRFTGWEDPGPTFDVALHLGTLIPLLIYFRSEWFQLAVGGFKLLRGQPDQNTRLAVALVTATAPGALAGVFFQDAIETTLRNPLIIGATLIILALVLLLAERIGKRDTELEYISFDDAMIVGCAQALALIPGVSRSGVTITAGLFRGLKREDAARFSFLLSTPIIAGAGAKKLFEIAREGLPYQIVPFIAGIIAAAIVGYLAIAFLMRYLSVHNVMVFVYYRIALGIIVFITFSSIFR